MSATSLLFNENRNLLLCFDIFYQLPACEAVISFFEVLTTFANVWFGLVWSCLVLILILILS